MKVINFPQALINLNLTKEESVLFEQTQVGEVCFISRSEQLFIKINDAEFLLLTNFDENDFKSKDAKED